MQNRGKTKKDQKRLFLIDFLCWYLDIHTISNLASQIYWSNRNLYIGLSYFLAHGKSLAWTVPIVCTQLDKMQIFLCQTFAKI